jgi:hypothetical protein
MSSGKDFLYDMTNNIKNFVLALGAIQNLIAF